MIYEPWWFIAVNPTVVHYARMARDDPQMKLRLSEELRARIAEAAKANSRSMNAEIVSTLESRYPELMPRSELIRSVNAILKTIEGSPEEPIADGIYYYLSQILASVENGGIFKSDTQMQAHKDARKLREKPD